MTISNKEIIYELKNIPFFSSFLSFIFSLHFFSFLLFSNLYWYKFMNEYFSVFGICKILCTNNYWYSEIFHKLLLFGIRYSEIFHEGSSSVFGIQKFFTNEDLWSSVFGNFSWTKIFGIRSSEIFHEWRSSVFGIPSIILLGATLQWTSLFSSFSLFEWIVYQGIGEIRC